DNKKVEVATGESNENYIIIKEGLKEGDEVYISIPKDTDGWPIVHLNSSEPSQETKDRNSKSNG
ncbi:MAG TPA: hypothetical protein PKU86_04855, partial [Bacteroidales bacterium]|nr:hypothetical protein [Bacteroidales bacterium]